ncbi:DUF1127 domain-containing protein [Marivibrio halodurans]|uniref:DUF1127 domain-containing protein n=1 Tax=Marivibrio halodurans TaxID=2039722 RepID=A0A8J7SJE2_9PROT|nr:DUF1127 domain-containing protein [Marivibrio halodurans]MBP5857678.1 DUF1127 domain-containing protein [Marivibrio halodurans]
MSTIIQKPGSFGSKAAFLAGSDRSGSEMEGAPRLANTGYQPIRVTKTVLATVWTLLRLWQERVEMRHHVRTLDDRLLKDIGVTRADVDSEIAKPFWRP